MLLLAGGCWLLTRRLSLRPSTRQAALEVVVEAIEAQVRDTMRVDPEPYVPLIGTLFLFIFAANWSSLVPGIEPPTAHIETDAALALIVFVAVICFGIRSRGLRGYLATFAEPSILMVPLNLVETVTRTFSLVVRLFGNVMSGVFVVGIVLVPGRPAGAGAADGPRAADRRGAGVHLQCAGHGLHFRRSRPGGGQRTRDATRRRRFAAMNWIQIASILGAALAVSFGAVGPALGEGRAVAAAMDAIARQPEAAGTISRTLFVGLAMIETMAIYCLVIALLLLFANPFVH